MSIRVEPSQTKMIEMVKKECEWPNMQISSYFFEGEWFVFSTNLLSNQTPFFTALTRAKPAIFLMLAKIIHSIIASRSNLWIWFSFSSAYNSVRMNNELLIWRAAIRINFILIVHCCNSEWFRIEFTRIVMLFTQVITWNINWSICQYIQSAIASIEGTHSYHGRSSTNDIVNACACVYA